MIPVERVREIFDYEESTGVLRWKLSLSPVAKAGSVAGTKHSGPSGKTYIRVRFDGVKHLAHRVIWVLFYGEQPPQQIDHKDGDGTNNRIVNLSSSNSVMNARNQKRNSRNTSGVTGVYWHKKLKKWVARIAPASGKRIHLGVFSSIKDAQSARKKAEQEYGYSKAHGSDRPL